MGKPILMDLIEAFSTIGFRSPYCQYEVVDSCSFNETRGEGRGSVKPLRASDTPWGGFWNKRPIHEND